MISKEYPKVILIRNNENFGFAKANNQALRKMKGQYALLLNSDAMLKKDTLRNLLQLAQENHSAAIIGPKLITENGEIQPSAYPLPKISIELLLLTRIYKLLPRKINAKILFSSFLDYQKSIPVDLISGACILVRKTAIDKVGILDENFFFYGEVHDWCLRMRKEGWQIWFHSNAEVIHTQGQSSKLKWNNLEQFKTKLKESERIISKHFSLISKWTFMILIFFRLSTSYIFGFISGKNKKEKEETTALLFEINWYWNRFRDALNNLFSAKKN
ncbi:MAG: glycosyltransferase, partial [Elusimicrobiales bacterium]|nr:glycosyltransferase [Elusimicrobiales bacterium]